MSADLAALLDPGMEVVLSDAATWSGPDTADPLVAGRAFAESFVRWSRPPIPVPSVKDVSVRGPRGFLWVRVYRPGPSCSQPILYMHGGAWSAGSLALADRFCRRLCVGTDRLVASVAYSLAPEEPYPAALDDCVAALTWLADEGSAFGADGDAPIVVGESAGANLAAALCLRGRDREDLRIARQVLICPILSDDLDTDSHRRWGGGEYLVSTQALADSWQIYLSNRPGDAYAAPSRANDLSGLPPATIVVAGCDPLHDDGVAFARRLVAAGVPAELIEAPGLLHGFIYMDGVSHAAACTVDRICALHSMDEELEV